jgi:hypothetical protein
LSSPDTQEFEEIPEASLDDIDRDSRAAQRDLLIGNGSSLTIGCSDGPSKLRPPLSLVDRQQKIIPIPYLHPRRPGGTPAIGLS